VAFALHIGAFAHQQQDIFLADGGDPGQVHRAAVDRGVVDLKVA